MAEGEAAVEHGLVAATVTADRLSGVEWALRGFLEEAPVLTPGCLK